MISLVPTTLQIKDWASALLCCSVWMIFWDCIVVRIKFVTAELLSQIQSSLHFSAAVLHDEASQMLSNALYQSLLC